jgi:ketosteroid isomerase-like protein
MFVVVNKFFRRRPRETAARASANSHVAERVRESKYNHGSLALMEAKAKNTAVPRAVVEAFYRALAHRDMHTLAGYLDDHVVWTISGPVDILPFCGQRTGKDTVMKLLVDDIPTFMSDRRFVPKAMLVDGDSAAVLGRLTATKRDDGHAISYRIAHFIKFRDRKVVEYVSIIDSFDAVEQMLGYNLEAHDGPRVSGDLVAI